jgi:hypothetical protein
MSNSNNLPTTTGVNNQELQSQLGNIQAMRKLAVSPMQYSRRITRNNPGAILILIDQSLSMDEVMLREDGVTESTKANLTTEIVNSFLSELRNRCDSQNGMRDYFNIAIIGYGQDHYEANIAWEGSLSNKDWISAEDLDKNILSIIETKVQTQTRFGQLVEKTNRKRIWITPKAVGLTPMKSAFEKAKILISDWVLKNENSFPPIIFNITDGEATDVVDFNELVDVCNAIREMRTNDGEPLIFNYHMSSSNENENLFPHVEEYVGDDPYTICLKKMSSILPEKISMSVCSTFNLASNSQKNRTGLMLNVSDLSNLTKLFDIGTRTNTN